MSSPIADDGNVSLVVGGLLEDTTEDSVRDLFRGNGYNVEVEMDGDSNRCVVRMPALDAVDACPEMRGMDIGGSRLDVQFGGVTMEDDGSWKLPFFKPAEYRINVDTTERVGNKTKRTKKRLAIGRRADQTVADDARKAAGSIIILLAEHGGLTAWKASDPASWRTTLNEHSNEFYHILAARGGDNRLWQNNRRIFLAQQAGEYEGPGMVVNAVPPGDLTVAPPPTPQGEWTIPYYNSSDDDVHGGKYHLMLYGRSGTNRAERVQWYIRVTHPTGEQRRNFPRHWKIANFFRWKLSTPEGAAELWDMDMQGLEDLLNAQDDPDLHIIDDTVWGTTLSLDVLRTAAETRLADGVDALDVVGDIDNAALGPIAQLSAMYSARFDDHFERQAAAVMNDELTAEEALAVVGEMAPALGGNNLRLNLREELGIDLPTAFNMENDIVFLSCVGAGGSVQPRIRDMEETTALTNVKSMMFQEAMRALVESTEPWSQNRMARLVEEILGEDGAIWYALHPDGALGEGNRFTIMPISRADLHGECSSGGSRGGGGLGRLYQYYYNWKVSARQNEEEE